MCVQATCVQRYVYGKRVFTPSLGARRTMEKHKAARAYASVARDIEYDPETGRVLSADVATDDCPVCFELTFKSDACSVVLWPFPCKHADRVHAACLTDFLYRGRGRIRCPVCFADFAPQEPVKPERPIAHFCLKCYNKGRAYATPAALAQHERDAHGSTTLRVSRRPPFF